MDKSKKSNHKIRRKSNSNTIRDLIEKGIHPKWLKAETKLIEPLLDEYQDWLKNTQPDKHLTDKEQATDSQQALATSLVRFLCFRLKKELTKIDTEREQNTNFNKRYRNAVNIQEQRQHILDYAELLGASWWHILGDKRAFSPWFGQDSWFGQDAMAGRYQRILKMNERRLAFFLKRLNFLASIVLEGQVESWQRLNLEKTLKPLLNYTGDTRVRLEALRCLSSTLKNLPGQNQEDNVSQPMLQLIYRASVNPYEDVWIQCEAIKLLESFSAESFNVVLKKRLTEPGEGDDLFVRKQAVQLLGENLQRCPELLELIPVAVKDPSPFVRQALAKALQAAPTEIMQTNLRKLVCEDEVAAVRAAGLMEILSLLPRTEFHSFLLRLLTDSLTNETDNFVLRVGLYIAIDGSEKLIEAFADQDDQVIVQEWQETLLKKIAEIHCADNNADNKPVVVRRWAAQAAERLWCDMEPHTRALYKSLQEQLKNLKREQRKHLARKIFRDYDENTFARVLAVTSQDNFGYDIKRNWFSKTITRGHRFGFRWWRFIHEFRYPDPSKRQGVRHTIGRHFSGQLHIPSGIKCEVAETKVPGEPLLINGEDGWRPYLPLVDELIDCLKQREIQIYTSEGVTTVKAPKYWLQRFRAGWKLSWRFVVYAQLRNWQEQGQTPADSYIQELQSLGFRINYKNHTYPTLQDFQPDPAVTRFFPLMLPFGNLNEFWSRLQEYFFSLYQNTFKELLIFAILTLGYFVATHLYASHLLNRTRANLPMVIGGWGTRGKSGTERIKAAMLNALGYSIFSKTTGCEAMFLYADPFDTTREMFLFRPYDKATIWEHYNVLRLADKMNMDIFLWECMGLTPDYVKILQRQWTRDDIATITNTYPDHEDLQGPAGIDIPKVMTNFIPRNSILLTSEEQMQPILQIAADELNTDFRVVNWLHAGLLPPDILKRFPYEEHPYNIALVVAVGDELGIPEDFALKEMADRVVLDIGVLKSYPIAPIRTRRLEFIMGMSANERFGCLNNWVRMELGEQDSEKEPDVWISTLVNNRADRIARSRVFASILVEDISADSHFIIGTNLTGMVGYIRKSWDSYVVGKTLWAETDGQENAPLANLQQAARALRIPITDEHIQARLRIMLSSQRDLSEIEQLLSLWQQPEKLPKSLPDKVDADNAKAIVERLKQDVKNYESYQAFVAKIEKASAADHNEDKAFRELLLRVMHSSQRDLSEIEQLLSLWQQPEKLSESLPDKVDADNAKAIVERLKQDVKNYESYQAFAAKIEKASAADHNDLDKAFRKLLWQWFEQKIVVVHDPYTPGNQIVNSICTHTPPGFHNRIMGMQNIKGTGLDFVYRWEAWETCHKAATQLKSKQLRIAEQGLNTLVSFQEYGPLSEEYVRKTITELKDTDIGKHAYFKFQFTLILSNLERVRNELNAQQQLGGNSKSDDFWQKLIGWIEAFLDPADAVIRRRRANQIYKDLAKERISYQKAALELQKLNKRQKGGWLSAKEAKWWVAGAVAVAVAVAWRWRW